MPQLINNSYLLTEEEYNKLTNPDVCYTLMTKTSAKKGVEQLIKFNRYTCWLDETVSEPGYCEDCPVMEMLGYDTGTRMCQRQKRWSK